MLFFSRGARDAKHVESQLTSCQTASIRLSALAEKNFGIAKEYENIVFFEVSNGIGAGIILDNHILRGASGVEVDVPNGSINSASNDLDSQPRR